MQAKVVLTRSSVDLRMDMRKLWEDHITWTRMFIISAAHNLPDKDATAQRLLANQEDIGKAVGTYYGKDAGDNVYARMTDEPFVVAVRRGLIDQISPDPSRWQDLSIFKFTPEQIHRVSVTTDKELSLERDQNNQWHWVKGNGAINQASLQSLLTILSNLYAVRWLGATTPQQGFDKPQLVLSFTTSPDNKASHKLTVGAQNNDGTFCARVEGRDGTFTISGSDFKNLKLPLVAQGTAASSPTMAPSPSAAP